MRLTFIVSIDPVKGIPLLDVLIQSLNLQTQQNFDVVFYNQTRMEPSQILRSLQITPRFPHRFFTVERFLGDFPLWDLYGLHQKLLESDLLGDYFMCMHMEEFFDADYVENVIEVLEQTGFDVLLGNLSRTRINDPQIKNILMASTASEFTACLVEHNLKNAPHWYFATIPDSIREKSIFLKRHYRALLDFGFRMSFRPDARGYRRLAHHYEDLYFMSKRFARKYHWFLPGRRLYFEDVQLCDIPNVCGLGRELRRLTSFPNYFNRRRIYHLQHRKYYYQFQDPGFTEALLSLTTEDRVLQTLQEAVRKYRDGSFTLQQALRYSRENPQRTGTQNLNHEYHMEALYEARERMRQC